MTRLFISEWDGRYDWLQTTAEHDVVWSIWAGYHSELSCAHLKREWQFHAKSHKLIDAFLVVLPTPSPDFKVTHYLMLNISETVRDT